MLTLMVRTMIVHLHTVLFRVAPMCKLYSAGCTCTLTAGVRDANGRSPLNAALDEESNWDNGRVGLYLIKHHGCVDEQDKARLLCKACKEGNLDVVKELVEQHDVDPNGECTTCYLS